jgi:hypothetical protein
VSWRSRYKAGIAVLGALVAIGMVGAAAVLIGVAQAAGTAQVAVAGVAGVTGAADASGTGADSTTAVTDQVSGAAQRGALAHWTTQRMLTATALSPARVRSGLPATTGVPTQPTQSQAVPAVTAPKGTPRAVFFTGSPTTGALFYTTGGKNHFCTASVVDSPAGDMVLTAAHCVYWKGFGTNIEYVPGYYDGKQPYGAWPVAKITVAGGWESSHNPDLDFAFLTTASVARHRIQARTGGLTIGFTRWYSEKIEVIGHNDTDAEPVRCATRSFKFRTGQMEFYCHGFWTGTSGGPWIIGYNAKNGTGTVFGVIGGYELGGDYEWASYSAYFGPAARSLYTQVEHQTAPLPKPTATKSTAPPATPSASPSASPTPTPTTAAPTPAAPPTAAPPTTSTAPGRDLQPGRRGPYSGLAVPRMKSAGNGLSTPCARAKPSKSGKRASSLKPSSGCQISFSASLSLADTKIRAAPGIAPVPPRLTPPSPSRIDPHGSSTTWPNTKTACWAEIRGDRLRGCHHNSRPEAIPSRSSTP